MDPISDMLIRIKNAQAARKETVSMPFSKVKFSIATILKDQGYIGTIDRRTRKAVKAELEYLDLGLKYDDSVGAIAGIRIISRPSRHIYAKAADIKPVQSGYGTAIISTSQGIMTAKAAKKANLGGEVMFEIW